MVYKEVQLPTLFHSAEFQLQYWVPFNLIWHLFPWTRATLLKFKHVSGIDVPLWKRSRACGQEIRTALVTFQLYYLQTEDLSKLLPCASLSASIKWEYGRTHLKELLWELNMC